MNIVSPNAMHKFKITMPPHLYSKAAEVPAMCTKEQPFSEYTLFLILEEERNLKLKEVYHKRCVSNLTSNEERTCDNDEEDTGLPAYPPRYQNLHFSVEWFISRLNNSRRPLPTKVSSHAWKSLDQITALFLQDIAGVLKDRYDENYQEACHSTPVHTPIFFKRSMTVTPPVSPASRRPNDGLDALLLAAELALPRLPLLEESDAVGEVDMSDGEIRAMWKDQD